MRLNFTRSAGWRFAVAFAGLLALSTVSIAWFLWWSTAGLINREVEQAIQSDAENLDAHWQRGGIRALILIIDERLAQDVSDDSIYLLIDARGRRIAGNLERWPPNVSRTNEFSEIRVERAGAWSLARVQAYDLTSGYRLIIGRDVEVRAKLRRLLTDALLWTLLIVAGIAMLGGRIVHNLFRRGIADVSATATAIAAGDLTRRVRRSGRGDEVDQLADVINEMLDRIGRLMDGVRQVSNAIAHDLRTPITRARVRLEEAARTGSDAELRPAIERAISDLDGIVGIFQALLRISEIEAGSRRASFAQVDIAPMLRDVAELYEVVAEERNVTMVVEIPETLMLFGDRALVQQATANLVDNALKFSPPGSVMRLVGTAGASGVEIRVSDQGPGIPVEEREPAVQRFYRGEAARNTPGSGLGLTLVSAVAQLHGGALRLEDASPGLLAILTLPASD